MPTVDQKAIGGISSDLTSYSARVCVPPYSQSLGHLADLESHRCCLCAAIFTKLGNHQLAYYHLKFFRKNQIIFTERRCSIVVITEGGMNMPDANHITT